jgi:hypothetical protein
MGDRPGSLPGCWYESGQKCVKKVRVGLWSYNPSKLSRVLQMISELTLAVSRVHTGQLRKIR